MRSRVRLQGALEIAEQDDADDLLAVRRRGGRRGLRDDDELRRRVALETRQDGGDVSLGVGDDGGGAGNDGFGDRTGRHPVTLFQRNPHVSAGRDDGDGFVGSSEQDDGVRPLGERRDGRVGGG